MPTQISVAGLLGVALCALALAPAGAAAQDSSRFYGVIGPVDPGDGELEMMREGGVRTYRWLVSWPALQHRAGAEPDWSSMDAIVTGLAEYDIEPMPLVYGSPCFAVDCDRLPAEQATRQPPIDSRRARERWTEFLGALVERYGPDGRLWSMNPSLPKRPVRTWQIWNEQNAPHFYRPAPSPRGYAELLRISAETIRSRDPGARIVPGGMFGEPRRRSGIAAAEFLQRLYEIGVRESFDAVAAHPYSPDVARVERQIVALRRVMDAHGDSRKPIWVTELGWGSEPEPPEGRLVKTLDGQAEMLTRAFGLLEDRSEELGIERVLWFSWRDTPPDEAVCSWCATSGLVDVDLEPKPAWNAYAALAGGTPEAPEDGGGVPAVVVALAAALVVAGFGGAWIARRRSRAR